MKVARRALGPAMNRPAHERADLFEHSAPGQVGEIENDVNA